MDLTESIEALKRDPFSPELARQVREGARARGALAEYARAFTERGHKLAERGHEAEAIASYIESALVYEEELDELAEAAGLYQRVLDLDPAHRRALFALGLLLHDLSRFDDLVALYRRRLEQSRDDNERTTLYLYLAEILSEKLSQDETAFEEIMRAARLAPQNIRIISRLERLGERAGRVDEVAVAIGDLILNQEDTRVRAALSLHLAELYMGPLDDHQRALAHYKAALSDDGGNPEILSQVEDVFRERERFDQLAELLEAAAGDRRVGPQRVRLERELARIYELELGDKKRALSALTRAARLFPEDRDLLDEVMRLGLAMGALDVVAATFLDVAETTSNGLLRTYLLLKLGHLYGNVLERPTEAIRAYERILSEDSSHKEARRRLGNLCERTGDFARLAELAEEEVRLADGSERVEPLRRLARVKARSLGDQAGAMDAYRDILRLAPDDAEARAVTSMGAPPAMPGVEASIVERSDELEPPTDVGEPPRFKPRAIMHDDGAETVKAPPYRRSMPPPPLRIANDEDDDPWRSPTGDYSPARSDSGAELGTGDVIGEYALTVTTSQAIAAEPLPPEEMHGDVRLRAPDDPWKSPTGDDGDSVPPDAVVNAQNAPDAARLVDLNLRLAEATRAGDRTQELSLLEEVVEAHLALGEIERAFFAEVRIVRVAPAEMAIRRMIELGRKAGAFGALLSTADEVSARLDLDAQIRLQLALADVETHDMSAPERAEGRLSGLYARAPDHPDVLDAWIALLERTRSFETLARVLEAEARRSQDPALWLRAAEARSARLEDHDGAASLMLAALERMPDEAEVREAALTYLGRASRWREVMTLHESRLYRVGGPERAVIRREIARVARKELGEIGVAEKMLRLALAEQPRDEDALEALLELYDAGSRWDAVIEVLSGQIALAPAGAPRATLRRRLAGVAEMRIGRRDLALQHLDGAVREDPNDLEALAAIERLRREAGDFAGVVAARVRMSRVHPEKTIRAQHAIEAARIQKQNLGDPAAAIALYREALALLPDQLEALADLAAIFEELGDFEGAVETLGRLAAAVEGVDRAHAHVRIGQLLERALGEDAEAGVEYARAVEAAPTDPDALTELIRWREAHEDYEGAAALIERQAELANDDRRRATLWSRLAEIARVRLGDPDRAIRASEQVLLADPDDLAVEAVLGELYAARSGEDDADRAYTHLARAARGLKRADAVRATQLYMAAGAAAIVIGLHDQAIAAYEAARELDPKRVDALWPLARLSAGAGLWARAHEIAAAIILHHESALAPEARAEAYALMARAERTRGDLPAAIRLAERSVATRFERLDVLALLADLHAETGAPVEAAAALERLAVLEPAERRGHFVRAARLLGDEEHDLGRAIILLAEMHAADPADIDVADQLAVYREKAGEPRGAVNVLSAAARALEGRPRAELLVRAARVAAGPASDRALGKQLLEEALSVAPDHRAAMAELALLVESDRDFPRLAELLATQGRLAEAAEIYRFRLDRPLDALPLMEKIGSKGEAWARTLEAAALADPAGAEAHRRRALDTWAELLEARPGHLDALRHGIDLSAALGSRWRARIYLEILAVLEEATPEEIARLAELAEVPLPRPKKTIDVPPHPREKSALDPLLAQIGYAPLLALGEDLPEPRPKKKDRVAKTALPPTVAAAIFDTSALLGADAPAVFVRDEAKEPITPTFFDEKPALIVSLALAGRISPRALAFHAGRAVSLLRARALPLVLLPLEIFREALEGMVRERIAPELLFGDPKSSKRRGKALERALSPSSRLSAPPLISEWLTKPTRATLFDEREAVLRTAERTGLAACGSLAVAAECMASLSGPDRRWRLPLVNLAASRELARMLEI